MGPDFTLPSRPPACIIGGTMNLLLPVAAAAVCLLLAYRWYPRYIARVFQEDDRNVPPASVLRTAPTT
jgi:hypothetical protein